MYHNQELLDRQGSKVPKSNFEYEEKVTVRNSIKVEIGH
jgi:hypothetical protein